MIEQMKAMGFKIGILLIIITFSSLPLSQPLALAGELALQQEKNLVTSEHTSLPMQSTGPEVAGGGLAGAGASRNIDPVIVRNVIIGLIIAGLLVASALNETE